MGSSAPVPRSPTASLYAAAAVLVVASISWFLLKELAPVLRPLLIAIILAYVLLPYHSWLRKRVTAPVSIVLLASFTAAVLFGLALAVYLSVLGLNDELPRLQQRVESLTLQAEETVIQIAPQFMGESEESLGKQLGGLATKIAGPVLNAAGGALVEAGVVALYLVFLLLEASRFPDRVRAAYPPDRAEEILHLAGQVNAAIISYLKAKVKSSLILAIAVGIAMAALGVRFAFLWAVLTFLCNFIPYIGSVVAFCLPVGFAVLQLEPGWRPVAAALLVLSCQAASAAIVEPMLLGKAVGLSPLVILGSLAFWGLLWGIPGMFLAIPLTVVAVIVMNHFASTRPVAKLLSTG
ncbi:MAG TPA: AI-2E family transporter [Urbifossiella sp.]|nr:AI-2E family transporter [Urbifossiella sp.]